MEEIVSQIEEIGIDVINPVSRDGELTIKSRALDRLGPSRINELLFDAFDAGHLSLSPFHIYVMRA